MSPAPRPLAVAAIGCAFMGKAHSQAWRNVAACFDVPPIEQRVLVGRDPDAAAGPAARYGWAESATDWREVVARDEVDIVDIWAPGWLHAKIAIAPLEAASTFQYLTGDAVTQASSRLHLCGAAPWGWTTRGRHRR